MTHKKQKLFSLIFKSSLSAMVVIVAFVMLLSHHIFAAGDAPVISNIKIASTTENTAVITWDTNVLTDSLINYGLDKNIGIARDTESDKKAHSITLSDLDPGTQYYFRVLSNDELGNQGVVSGLTFTTAKDPDVPDTTEIESPKERALTEKIASEITEITSPQALGIIQQTVEAVGGEIALPPTIMGVPDIKEISYDYIVVGWRTEKPASTMATFSSEFEYKPDEFPYTYTQGDPNSKETNHEIKIIGLVPATKYHLRVFSEDALGLTGKSNDQIFTTKSLLPVIKNIDTAKIEDTAVTIIWDTTIPASGNVVYTNMTTQEVKTQGSPEFATNHSVRIENLTFGTQYDAIVTVENDAGDKVVSEPFSFVTIKDVAPPVIESVTNESTLYPTEEAKVQTIVNWSTDELAKCQFFYRQSLADTGEASSIDAETELDTTHVQVVLEFLPATVYKFWVECKDKTENTSRSEDFVLFTPDKQKSILDIIIENFQGTFGWVKNIGA